MAGNRNSLSAFTYAIGDIHGCLAELEQLLADIDRHAGNRPRRLVFLGDYCDRGPASAGVIRRLRDLTAHDPSVVCLIGNHEDMLLRARYDQESWWHWIMNGGQDTLTSYGVDHVSGIPEADQAWLFNLPTLFEDTLRFFVHAGLNPRRPVQPENRKDRLWIRNDFLDADHDFGKHVVHGHTPLASAHPDLRRHRTNLDTACVFGGRLTAGVFNDDQAAPVDIVQVARKA